MKTLQQVRDNLLQDLGVIERLIRVYGGESPLFQTVQVESAAPPPTPHINGSIRPLPGKTRETKARQVRAESGGGKRNVTDSIRSVFSDGQARGAADVIRALLKSIPNADSRMITPRIADMLNRGELEIVPGSSPKQYKRAAAFRDATGSTPSPVESKYREFRQSIGPIPDTD